MVEEDEEEDKEREERMKTRRIRRTTMERGKYRGLKTPWKKGKKVKEN